VNEFGCFINRSNGSTREKQCRFEPVPSGTQKPNDTAARRPTTIIIILINNTVSLTASADGSRRVSAAAAVVPLAVVCRAAVPPWPSSSWPGTSVFATRFNRRGVKTENASGRYSRWPVGTARHPGKRGFRQR